MGAHILATAFTAESNPMTAPRLFGGTHCMRRMGTAGVKSGMPATYVAAAIAAVAGFRAAPMPASPADTKVRPSAVVRVSPMAFCTRANPVELMVNETAASAVSHAPIWRGSRPRFRDAYSGKNESKVDCPALYRKLVTQMVATAVTSRVPSGHSGAARASSAPAASAAASARAD